MCASSCLHMYLLFFQHMSEVCFYCNTVTLCIITVGMLCTCISSVCTDGGSTPGSVSSPSLPLGDLHGAEDEYVFLLMEAIRATIEGDR